MKTFIRLGFISVLLFISVWIYILVDAYKAQSTYGYFSVIKPLPYRLNQTSDTQLLISFSPSEPGLGIIKLNLNHDDLSIEGVVSVETRDNKRDMALSRNSYTTTHLDNSKHLLIGVNDMKFFDSGLYQLVISAQPHDLLKKYFSPDELQAQGVYFIDKLSVITDIHRLWRLIQWKAYDIAIIFSFEQICYLIFVPLLIPYALLFLKRLYKSKRLRREINKCISLLNQHIFDGKAGKVKVYLSDVISHLYFLSKHVYHFSYHILNQLVRAWLAWYVAHRKLFWDCLLVIMWISANLVFILTSIQLIDIHYLLFVGMYMLFSLLQKPEPKVHYIGAFITLLLCPYFLTYGKEIAAEKSAIFVYFFLMVGALGNTMNMYREKRKNNA